MDYEQLCEKLKAMLTEKRYQHSLGVMDTALQLALRYGCDTGKAKLAGLLHDCAKNYDVPEMLTLCEQYGVVLDKVTAITPGLIHQVLGAEMARREFGAHDEEVLSAIRCHTTGKPDMSLLEKILYLADFTEPGREWFEGLDALRELTASNLDDAMRLALDLAIKDVLFKGQPMHIDTANARNQLIISKMKNA